MPNKKDPLVETTTNLICDLCHRYQKMLLYAWKVCMVDLIILYQFRQFSSSQQHSCLIKKQNNFFFPYWTNLTQKFNCEPDSFVRKRKKLFQTKQAKFIYFTKFLDGHTSTVQSVFFSPNGNTLASGSDDQSIRLWDIKTSNQKAKLDCHTSTLYSFSFLPDGNTLVSVSYDNSILLWDHITCKQIQPQNKNYQEILHKYKPSLFYNPLFPNFVKQNIPIHVLSANPYLLSNGSLILKRKFLTIWKEDLQTFFESRGSCILENLNQIQQK